MAAHKTKKNWAYDVYYHYGDRPEGKYQWEYTFSGGGGRGKKAVKKRKITHETMFGVTSAKAAKKLFFQMYPKKANPYLTVTKVTVYHPKPFKKLVTTHHKKTR
jgi:hypothetical protein